MSITPGVPSPADEPQGLSAPAVQSWSLGSAPSAVDYRILLDFTADRRSWQLWTEWLSGPAASEAFLAWVQQGQAGPA